MPITEGGQFTPTNKIVSPGVFTRENDLSGVAQGVADIGAAIVSPFPKGPGFAPTIVSSTAELEEKFGVADGVYYGPYTAKEYLKEKGFVTVVRVGSLTGYEQRYPVVIYAESGSYNRNGSVGAALSASSFLGVSGSLQSGSAGYLAGVSVGTVTGTSATVTFTSSSFTFTFAGSAIDSAATSASINSTSGSILYSGQVISLGNVNSIVSANSIVSSSITSSASDTAKLDFAIQSGSLYGSLSNVTFANAPEPFNNATLVTGSYTVYRGTCSYPVIRIAGVLSGSFGKFNGSFTTAGSASVDNCGVFTTGSGTQIVLAVLADTQNATLNSSLQAPGFSGSTLISSVLSSDSSSIAPNYKLSLSGSSLGGYGSYQFSLDSSKTNYITNVFGTDPTAGDPAKYVAGTKKEAAYINTIFEDTIGEIVNNPNRWNVKVSMVPDSVSFGGNSPLKFTDTYSTDVTSGDSAFALTNASTPWVISQNISTETGESVRYSLFRLHTMSDGTEANTSHKIEISDVKVAGTVAGSDYGSFTLSVRDYSDTDKKPKYLEIYQNLSLDPDSANFVARRIGDRYNYITYAGKIIEFGTYANASKYVRIEMVDNVYPISAVPYGFEAYATPLAGDIAKVTPVMQYSKASLYGTTPGKYPSGVVFGEVTTLDNELTKLYPTSSAGDKVYSNNLQYFAPIGANSRVGNNTFFALDKETTLGGVSSGSLISGSNAVPATTNSTYVKMRKFIFGFQGGFDGKSPATPINTGTSIIAGNTQGLDCTNITSAGSVAYKQVIGALGNADEFDINLIATPGIFHSIHSYVAQLVIDMCETRGDVFYIMDGIVFPRTNQTVGMIDSALTDVSTLDTSYAATYYPWIKILDTNTNKIISVPPSVVMPAIYASSDKAGAEWFAPAGLNRGGITQAVQVLDRLTHAERDDLYEGRINPIAAFPGQGICAWGQKTLQVKSSALDRIAVRRLMIELKKFIASSSKFLVFEQNVASTRNKFLAIVNPYLESVQQRSGLYAFQVKMDEANNTADLIDKNILYGQIYLQPTRTSEFIILDFNVLPTGASFGA